MGGRRDVPIGVALETLQAIAIALFPIAVMLSVGVDLTPAQVKTVLARPLALGAGLVVNHLVAPVLALLLGRAVGLEEPLLVGIVLVAAAPGSPMGAMFAQRARGDLGVAVSLLVVMTLLNTVATPAVLALLELQPEGADPTVHALAIAQTVALYLLAPLGVGMAIRHARPALAARLRPGLQLGSNLIFAGLTAGLVARHLEEALAFGLLPIGVAAAVVLGTMAFGYAFAGRDRGVRVAISLMSGTRAISLGLLIASHWYQDPATLLAVLLFGMVQTFAAFGVTLAMRVGTPASPTG